MSSKLHIFWGQIPAVHVMATPEPDAQKDLQVNKQQNCKYYRIAIDNIT